MSADDGIPFGWEVERRVDDLDLGLRGWQRDLILKLWPEPANEPHWLDEGDWVREAIEGARDRIRNPWNYRDRNPMPRFVPLPALERARIRAQVVAGRVRGAWAVLCGRERVYEDRSDW